MLPKSVVQDSPIQVIPVIVMQEVFIDSLRPQKYKQVCVFLQGGHVPPMRKISIGAPLRGSTSPPTSSFSYFISDLLSYASWLSCLGPIPPDGEVLPIPHPPSLPIPLPPLSITLLPLSLSSWMCRTYCLGLVADVWPLCRPTPASKFTMLARILLA